MSRHVVGLLVLSIVASAAARGLADDNWPQFRGAESLGTSTRTDLPDRWSGTDNVLWKQPIAGRGWSSPIVWGDKVFLTTVINQGDEEEAKRGLYFGGDRNEPPKSTHQWKVYCLNLANGAIVWEQLAHEGVPETSHHIKNSFASETPVTDGQRVYVYFGNVGLFCYDLDGNPLWSKKIGPFKIRNDWGTAASPVLNAGRLYVVSDNDDKSFLVALDAQSGEEIWRVDRDEKSNWSTPYVWHHDQRAELITTGTNKIRSYDLDGKPLWELGGMSSITIPMPFSGDGLLFVASGYVMDKLRPIYAIRPGASGDITPAEGQTTTDSIAWLQKEAGPYNTSPLLYGDNLYVLLDRGMLSCYDAKTGAPAYEKKRLPESKAFTSSPWAYNGKVFCLNEFGQTFVVEAGPEFKVLYTNDLPDETMCMATPAIAGNKLLLRTAAELYCIENGAHLAQATVSESAK